MNRQLRYSRPRTAAAQSLTDFLVQRFPYFDAKQWETQAHQGYLFINDTPCTSAENYTLQQGDMIRYSPPSVAEPEVDTTNIVKVFDAKSARMPFIVVEKNGNLPVCPGGRYFQHTLIAVLEKQEAEAKQRMSELGKTQGGQEEEEEGGKGQQSKVDLSAPHRVSKRQRRIANDDEKGSTAPRLHPIHRLDKETSGLVVIARTRECAAFFGNSMKEPVEEGKKEENEKRESSSSSSLSSSVSPWRKIYIAVVLGVAPIGASYEVRERIGLRSEACKETSSVVVGGGEGLTEQTKPTLPLQKSPLEKLVMACYPEDSEHGKSAKSIVAFVATDTSLNLSVALVHLYSGRTHQIRLHCAHLGFPILGDKLYDCRTKGKLGGSIAVPDDVYLERVRSLDPLEVRLNQTCTVNVSRHLLHAAFLSFQDPNGSVLERDGNTQTANDSVKSLQFTSSPVSWFSRDVSFDSSDLESAFKNLLEVAMASDSVQQAFA